MLIPYTAPAGPHRTETTIQKSIFIADLTPVSSMEEAQAFWASRKKEFRDATHHCFACRVGTAQIQEKSSDDGEPQGTAGHPMLHVLQMQHLTNTAAVVTRYFGGIKLGAGGLTRAYSGSLAACAGEAPLLVYTPHLSVTLTFGYDMVGAFENYIKDTKIRVTSRAFTDVVTITLLSPPDLWPAYSTALTNLSAGKIRIEAGDEEYVPLPKEK